MTVIIIVLLRVILVLVVPKQIGRGRFEESGGKQSDLRASTWENDLCHAGAQ